MLCETRDSRVFFRSVLSPGTGDRNDICEADVRLCHRFPVNTWGGTLPGVTLRSPPAILF